MLSWGPGQIVIVYVPRACTKQNLESILPIIIVLGHILLVFGYFGIFGFFETFWGNLEGPQSPQSLDKHSDVNSELHWPT